MSDLENQYVKEVRKMTDAELAREGWEHHREKTPTVIVFEDGTNVYPSKDPEGNGPGALFGINEDDQAILFDPK